MTKFLGINSRCELSCTRARDVLPPVYSYNEKARLLSLRGAALLACKPPCCLGPHLRRHFGEIRGLLALLLANLLTALAACWIAAALGARVGVGRARVAFVCVVIADSVFAAEPLWGLLWLPLFSIKRAFALAFGFV